MCMLCTQVLFMLLILALLGQQVSSLDTLLVSSRHTSTSCVRALSCWPRAYAFFYDIFSLWEGAGRRMRVP